MENKEQEKKPLTKENIAMLIIERNWYLNVVDVLQRAFDINKDELARYLKIAKPEVTKESVDNLIADLEKIFKPTPTPKTEEKKEA